MTNIEALVAEYGTVMKAYGRSLGVGDRLIAIDHSGSADRRFEAIRNALTEQAETHAIELRAYEATVANLEWRIRQLEAEQVPEWKQQKPTTPGAYWLKGNIWMHPEQTSLVRIEWFDGELCIVYAENEEDPREYLSDWRDDFYWFGPLTAAPQQQKEGE